MADQSIPYQEFLVHLARLGLAGRSQDVQAYLHRIVRRIRSLDEALARSLGELASEKPSLDSPLRDAGMRMVPVDSETRLRLLRHEDPVALDRAPILPSGILERLSQVVEERRRATELGTHGLRPTRSLLFTGPPGVGKTLTARWIASTLQRPLLTLDLSAVMSSFLGKTGANLRNVLDYAKSSDCVLLLDEFDAIAKRRDDESEIGELKRLVTVLLQEIDDWPGTGLLIAASNHGDLLDPAIWRRFDHVMLFPLPDRRALQAAIREDLGNNDIPDKLDEALACLWEGLSLSDVTRQLSQIRRRCVIDGKPLLSAIENVTREEIGGRPLRSRRSAAEALIHAGIPDRQVTRLTGVARDTLRKARRSRARS